MVSVDVRLLDLDQIANHHHCRVQVPLKDIMHHLDNLLFQVLETCQLLHVNVCDHSSQLVVDHVNALNGGRLKTSYLLLGQVLKCGFGHEEVHSQRACISDGRLDIIISECIEGVNGAD